MDIGPVVFRLRDAREVADFYEDALGFETVEDGDGDVRVRSGGEMVALLVDDPAAVPRPPRAPGLYHIAFLYPSREALGEAVARLRDAGGSLTGAADHDVSEAVYTKDPAGNGVELYTDRPRDEWTETGDRGVRITTEPLDVGSLVADADPRRSQSATVGHVHLEVTDLGASERFYSSLGFERRATVQGARFLGAEGYHHHVGINTWSSPDGRSPDNVEGIVGFCVEGADGVDDPDGVRVFGSLDQTVY